MSPASAWNLLKCVSLLCVLSTGCAKERMPPAEAPKTDLGGRYSPALAGAVRIVVALPAETRAARFTASVTVEKSQITNILAVIGDGKVSSIRELGKYIASSSKGEGEYVVVTLIMSGDGRTQIDPRRPLDTDFLRPGRVDVGPLTSADGDWWEQKGVVPEEQLAPLRSLLRDDRVLLLGSAARAYMIRGKEVDRRDEAVVDRTVFRDVSIRSATNRLCLYAFAKDIGVIAVLATRDFVSEEIGMSRSLKREILSETAFGPNVSMFRVGYYFLPHGTQMVEYVNERWLRKGQDGLLYPAQ